MKVYKIFLISTYLKVSLRCEIMIGHRELICTLYNLHSWTLILYTIQGLSDVDDIDKAHVTHF